MEHFNYVLFIVGGFFVAISSIKPSNTSHKNHSDLDSDLEAMKS